MNSRFSPRRVAHVDKLMAYSYEKSWSNGLCFYLWAISWLRSHGVTATIVFTVDHGEEFGGKSWLKVQELRKVILLQQRARALRPGLPHTFPAPQHPTARVERQHPLRSPYSPG